jgi:hypothetical protein
MRLERETGVSDELSLRELMSEVEDEVNRQIACGSDLDEADGGN